MIIPEEVLQAERTLSRWFESQNVRNWKLGGCMARHERVPVIPAGLRIDVKVTSTVPPGEVWFVQGGKVVGKILDAAVSKERE